MAVVDVTFDGVRLHDSDDNTGWGNYGSGGGAPSSEGANAYQITTGAAANTGVVGKGVKVTGSSRVGVDYNGTAVDYTIAPNRLMYLKLYVTDAFDLQTAFGLEFSMGSADQSNYHEYVVAGSDAVLSVYYTYPPQGGYLITCIDPNIDTWANVADSGGTTDQTAIVWYGMAAVFQNGNSKSENLAFDSIDHGAGLILVSGDAGSTQGKYTDFYVFDQDDINNRWGAAVGGGDSVICRGVMQIGGGGTTTEFVDTTSIVTFPDGYHSRGLFGVVVNLDDSGNIIEDGALIVGQGTANGTDANDTRPDYTVVGTTVDTADFSHQLRNFRDITYTSVCDVDGADIECLLLVQNSANISNTIIRANTITSVACLQDPTFGSSTDLNNVEFIQGGVGHAIELDTATTYDFTEITFTGFGADTDDDAALDVTASSGTVTINVSGGTATPTYKSAGATVVIVATVNVTLSGLRDDTEIRVMEEGSNTVELAGIEDATVGTTDDRSFTFGLAAGTAVDIYIVNVTYENIEIYDYDIPSVATTLPQQQRFDRSYKND